MVHVRNVFTMLEALLSDLNSQLHTKQSQPVASIVSQPQVAGAFGQMQL